MDACSCLYQRLLVHFLFKYLTVWGVEPVVTHYTSWLESTGVCGVRRNQAGGTSVQKRAEGPIVSNLAKYQEVLTSHDAVKRAVNKSCWTCAS